MAEINYNGNIIVLSSEAKGIAYPWGGTYPKQHHVVHVEMDGHRTSFNFYCNDGGLDGDALIEAFYYFLSDGCSYANARDIDDFQSEFIEAYNGCKDAYDKWSQFGIDIYEITNWLQETYDL